MKGLTLYRSQSSSVAVVAALMMALTPGKLHSQPPPVPPITVVSAGLGCSAAGVSNGFPVLTWKLGAELPPKSQFGSGLEAAAGRPSFSDVTVTKSFDECSAVLFQSVATGKILQTLTLTQSVGGIAKMTVVLRDVLVSSYDLSGGISSPLPTETIEFRYQRITITNLSNGSKACFDTRTNSPC